MPESTHSDNQTGWSSTRYQRVLAVTYFLILAAWSLGIAFHGAPDESTHFFLLEYLKAYHSMPDAAEPVKAFTGTISGHTWQPGDFWYHGLPFPHVIGALISSYGLSWMLPSEFAYLAVRCFNWILGAIFICALFRIGHRAGMPKKAAALGALAVALVPQVSFAFSYFNSDAYGVMSVALLLSALLGFLKTPAKYTAICLGGSIGLMLMAKLYLLPALVFAGVMFAATQVFGKQRLTKHIATILLVAVIVSAPMLVFTYLEFGEITGISGQLQFVEMHKTNPAAGFGTCYIGCSGKLLEMGNIAPWITLTLMSYFSVTGWMNIFISPPYYTVAALLFMALVLAAIIQTLRVYSPDNKSAFLLKNLLPLIMILGLFPSIILLSLLASQNSMPQPQGRYLFVTLPFLAMLIAIATTRYSSAQTSASVARAVKSDRFYLKCLIVLATWMAWTNAVSWSANTLNSTNIQKSAIGRPIVEAIKDSETGKDPRVAMVEAQQLTQRLFLEKGEFLLKAPQSQTVALGNLDEVRKTADGWVFRGWSYIAPANGTPQYLVAVEAGKVVGAMSIDVKRPDVAVALGDKAALRSGYEGPIATTALPGKCDLKLYTVSSTFKIFAMPNACELINRSPH
ncbi:glycosyltransferase family 39 protein [Pseudomonas alliivorans]|nr:glycosyltransferase family 39 protein [Pseudomonas alliivorans]MEE4815253.1 glycosyltransferase family 39 protein [Pseudomonas alliivorans]MEE4875741.1 glycosyltransferase family 39 protein [Pseudomonas alliivorans]